MMLKMFPVAMLTFAIITLSPYNSFLQIQDDPTIATLQSAQNSYQNGEFKRAISQLRRALALVQKRMVDNINQFFPKPFAPWEEMEGEGEGRQVASSRNVVVKKLYYHSKTSASIEIEIALDASRAANLRAWIANPLELNRSSQGAELITINGHRCVQKFDKKMKNGEISTVVGAGILIRAVGDGIKKMDAVRKFMELMDFKAMGTQIR